jgi:protein-L-isoaspartate(D-aspartate) O-methyltransferase
VSADPYRYQRERLVEELERKGIGDPRVLEAMRWVPRHLFVPEARRNQAYQDHALPIGERQTISQPWVVARMTEHLAPGPGDSVLEIGTGSGYQTAVLARLARVVYSIERLAPLAQTAIARMRELSLSNVKIHVFDGTVGWSDWAPYDRILVTAGAPGTPQRLLDQLANGGRMVVPEGDLERQRLVLYEKDAQGKVTRAPLEAVAFVPLIGREGWSQS